MNDLWDRYNAEPELQAKVDALFEAQVAKGSPYYQTLETYRNNGEKRRKVWVFDNGLSISRMPVRAAWEILNCGYCYKDDINLGYVINGGAYPHCCPACRALRTQKTENSHVGAR